MRALLLRLLLSVTAGAFTGQVARADIAYISGTTLDGHFTDAGNHAVGSAVLHFIYSPASFPSQDAALALRLGSFTLGSQVGTANCSLWSTRSSCTDDYWPYTFQLTLSLGVPVGGSTVSAAGQISGDVQGRLVVNGLTKTVSGGVGILFPDTPTLFTFTDPRLTGSLEVTVNDLLDVKPGQTAFLTGSIGKMDIRRVPEASSIASSAVMFLAAFVLRRLDRTGS